MANQFHVSPKSKGPVEWIISSNDKMRYDQQFQQLSPGSCFLSGAQSRDFFLQSKLPPPVLMHVWNLSDLTQDGRMDKAEFAIAMCLIEKKLAGHQLPATLPPSLKKLPAVQTVVPGHPGGQRGSIPVAFPVSGYSQSIPLASQPTPTGFPVSHVASPAAPVVNRDNRSVIPSNFGGSVEWMIPPEFRSEYKQRFMLNDTGHTGFVGAQRAKDILMQTGVPTHLLLVIWDLADIDKDGQLNCDEFILAMYLVDMVLQGKSLPPKLPPELIPPQMRKQFGSPIETSPVGAIPVGFPPKQDLPKQSSIPAPQTFLPDNTDRRKMQSETNYFNVSFEDKKRENFERGQAELEKRRLALLDQDRREREARLSKERDEEEKRRQEREEAEQRRQRQLEEERKALLDRQQAIMREQEKLRKMELEKSQRESLDKRRQKLLEQLALTRSNNKHCDTVLEVLNEKQNSSMKQLKEATHSQKKMEEQLKNIDYQKEMRRKEIEKLNEQLSTFQRRLREADQQRASLQQQMSDNVNSNPAAVLYKSVQTAVTAKRSSIQQLSTKITLLDDQTNTKMDSLQSTNKCIEEMQDILKTLEKKNILQNQSWVSSTSSDPFSPAPQSQDSYGGIEFTAASQMPASPAQKAPGVNDMPLTPGEILTYTARFAFTAESPDELSLQPGDIIKVSSKQVSEQGWLGGTCNGKTGWFPESYVEKTSPVSSRRSSAFTPLSPVAKKDTVNKQVVVETEFSPTSASQLALNVGDAIHVTKLKDDWYFGTNSVGKTGWFPQANVEDVANSTSRIEKAPPVIGVADALFAYESVEPGDLTFPIGAVIQIIKQEGDWWTGSIGNRSGIFPANFVSLRSGAESPQMLPPSPPTELATVLSQFTAKSDDQLSLSPGQTVIINKKTDTGWWEGSLQSGSKKGWFPSSFVKALPLSPTSGNNRNSNTCVEKVIALYDFLPSRDDELAFKAGDVISILDKKDATWCKGELEGRTGMFPYNFVRSLKDS